MQDRRQLCFILALIGGIFALGTAFMMLAMSAVVFGAMPFAFGGPEAGLFLVFFGWLALASGVGGVVMVVGAVRLRNATGPAARSAAVWCIVGGALSVLGGNLLSAAGGIVAGALVLTELPAPVPA